MCNVIVDSIDIKNHFPSVIELGISTDWDHDFKDEKVINSLWKYFQSYNKTYFYSEMADILSI